MDNQQQNSPLEIYSKFRKSDDRRGNYMRSFVYSTFKRRRKKSRRETDDTANTFVDFHEPKLAFVFLLTLVLCITDVVLTLNIIGKGGEEVNPIMKFLMEKDLIIFFWVKFAMTSLGMLFLMSHKNFRLYRIFSGYHLFYAVAVMYVVLVNYEIILISRYIPGS